MIETLASIDLEIESDVFAARQRAREAAALLGLDDADQVRAATALSELCRVIVGAGTTATITLGVEQEATPEMAIVVVTAGEFPVDYTDPTNIGVGAARRLMDSFVVDGSRGGPVAFSMTKRLPRGRVRLGIAALEDLRYSLARLRPNTPLDELRGQNLELVATLEELTAKQCELVRLNDELTETNQGVVAMYSQLSAELEETNRGVVALYAELDERGLELRDANEAKSRFLASISHELRGPLNSVVGLSRFLREPDSEPLTPSQQHQVELIERGASEVLGLVNDLLDLAKAESGTLNPTPVPVDLTELCADLRSTLRPLAAPGVDVVVSVPPDLGTIETDPTLLAQLIRNLLTNALKFTERGTVEIAVRPRPSANLVEIAVTDSGIGIDPEHLDLIFEEFFQVPGRLQQHVKSTGLGLPYARRVAGALGGTLEVASTPGAGSAFTATIPVRWSRSPDQSDAFARGRASATFGTALIVDDEASYRTLLREMLQGSASRVIEASNGHDALELMREVRPDIVLLDLRMPGGDGESVLLQASIDEALRSIPIAIITSVDLGVSAMRGLGPAFAVINKSDLTRQVLLNAIRTMLAKS